MKKSYVNTAAVDVMEKDFVIVVLADHIVTIVVIRKLKGICTPLLKLRNSGYVQLYHNSRTWFNRYGTITTPTDKGKFIEIIVF